MKHLWWLFAVLLSAGCEQPQPESTPAAPPAVKVYTVGEVAGTRRGFPGRVRAAERTELSFRVRGRIVELPVRQGDEVEKGAVIGRLDDRDFRADLSAARAVAEEAAENQARGEELAEEAFISVSELARLRSTAQTTASELAIAEKALEDTVLVAPFDGTVARRYVENFQEVLPNEDIISLQDSSVIEIVVPVPENLIAQRERDAELDIRAEFDSLPGQAYSMTIKEFATEADASTQTFEMVLVMPRPQDANILPGMTAMVYATVLAGGRLDQSIKVVPASAVFSDNAGQSQVWIVAQDNTVSLLPVVTGRIQGNDGIEIVEGLATGDVIVTAGVHQLRDGMMIRPITRVDY